MNPERLSAINKSTSVLFYQTPASAYPANLTRSLPLLFGLSISLRPIHPGDSSLVEDFLESLSTESGYNRFLGPAPKPTTDNLHRLTHIDYLNEMALLAVVFIDGVETEIGVARYVTDTQRQSCEIALVVADAWQRCGFGRALLQGLLDCAANAGLQLAYGYVLATNQGMLTLAKRMGFRVHHVHGDATLRRIEISLMN